MDNNAGNKENSGKTAGMIIGTVFFFLSFAPYLYLIYAGIDGITFGMQGIGHFYGFFGAVIAFFLLTFTGIIPICLIYQIKFGKKHISDNRTLKKITIILSSVIVLTVLLLSPIANGINKIQIDTEPSRIRNYLASKYGEEMAGEAIIDFDHEGDWNTGSRYYKVHTNVLPSDKTFEVSYNPCHKKRMSDDLMQIFTIENPDFIEGCQNYIRAEYSIPNNMEINKDHIESIRFGDYDHLKDPMSLYNKTSYVIERISITAADDSEQTIRGIIDQIWANEYLKRQAKKNETNFVIKIYVGESEKATVFISARSENAKATAKIYFENNTSSKFEIKLD